VASATDENQLPEEEKMELEQSLRDIQKTLGEISASSTRETEATNARIQQLTEALNSQQQILNSQQQLLQTIQTEREQSIATVQSQTLAAQKAQEHQELIAAIGTVVQSQVQAHVGSLKEEIITSINPKRVPPRITGSLVGITASGQENQQSNAVRDELLVISGELKALGEDQATNPRRIALMDRAHILNQQLSIS
jgi:hypothetical protein